MLSGLGIRFASPPNWGTEGPFDGSSPFWREFLLSSAIVALFLLFLLFPFPFHCFSYLAPRQVEQLQRQFASIHSALVQPSRAADPPAAPAQLPHTRKLSLNQSQTTPLNAQPQCVLKGQEAVGSSCHAAAGKRDARPPKVALLNEDQFPVGARAAHIPISPAVLLFFLLHIFCSLHLRSFYDSSSQTSPIGVRFLTLKHGLGIL
jgi:hypothetical protein